MSLALFDVIGIIVYLLIAAFIYKKGWFFSFYSFVKFLIVLSLSFLAGLNLAQKNIEDLPLTNLQLSLIIQGAVFAILWKFVSFRRLFFTTTDSVVSINRFIFFHHIDRVIALIPAAIVSFFITFFAFTIAVTASTNFPTLAAAIEDSKIIKPVSYQIYFAKIFRGKLFEGIAFNIIPPATLPGPQEGLGGPPPTESSAPGGTGTFQPPTQTVPTSTLRLITPTPLPTAAPGRSTFVPPIVRAPTTIKSGPTPTTAVARSNPIPTPTTPSNPTSNNNPTPTPARASAPSQNTSQAEQDIFRMTNEERAKNGLPPYSWDDSLANVARNHSSDMVARNFFSHNNPDGKTPFDRMKAAGISYKTAGENIAAGATADLIMANWMNSPGHRANILKPEYGKIGVGVVFDSKYGLMATQNFTN